MTAGIACVSSRRSPSRAVVPFEELPPSSYSSQPRVSGLGRSDSPASFIYDGQRGTLHIEQSILALSIASRPPAALLPPKLGCTKAANVDKLLKTWSGRRGSNPRVQLGK